MGNDDGLAWGGGADRGTVLLCLWMWESNVLAN